MPDTRTNPVKPRYAPMAVALVLLGLFVAWNQWRDARSKAISKEEPRTERESLPDTTGLQRTRLAAHDFEGADPADPAQHLATKGHNSRQSYRLTPDAPFSPGLWIRHRDLPVGKELWLRASGYVWVEGPDSLAKCSLVATCNHQGTNFKYLAVEIEKEHPVPGQWNRFAIDYRIPPVPDGEDVVQVYFWYRGAGEMLVDDIGIDLYTDKKKNNRRGAETQRRK